MKVKRNIPRVLFPAGAILVLFPYFNSASALVLGILLALLLHNPYVTKFKTYSTNLLALSVMGLGAQMDLNVVAKVGAEGISYTFFGILLVMSLGIFFGKVLKVERDMTVLISGGTAICGGSAIAALSKAIKAKPNEVSISLATVFLLNALALIIFPWVGTELDMTESQFGLWSALAIHDTSSVVGASMTFGEKALAIGTTVKLARALWIVPLTIVVSLVMSKEKESLISIIKKQWFIIGFLLMAALVTYIPDLKPLGGEVALLARRGFVLTLFFIGSCISRDAIKAIGFRPLILGVGLWFVTASVTLYLILNGVIH